jgi:hypothetical protein
VNAPSEGAPLRKIVIFFIKRGVYVGNFRLCANATT